MMVRMQVTLPPEEHKRAKAQAAARDISLAEYVRRLISRDVGQSPASSVEAVFDLGESAGSNVARHKDAYLAEAFARDHE